MLAEREGFEPIKIVICCYVLLSVVMRGTLEFQRIERETLEMTASQQKKKSHKKGAKRAHAKRPEQLRPGLFTCMKISERR